jgi:curved DNA-binding protein CbpA
MTSGALDPYKVLQVDSEAEDEVIQAAYRRLAQKYHPDVASGPEAAARMAGINSAWEILRDPAKRAAHDLSRRLAARDAERAAAAGAAPASAAPAPPHRSSGAAGRGTGAHGGRTSPDAAGAGSPPRGPETVSSDWTSGRSSQGGGYDPSQMGSPDGFAAAGPPPGDPSGPVLNFGRFAGWSLGEIARRDLDYIEWLDRMPIGRSFRDELDVILRQAGRRKSAAADEQQRRGLFRRR